MTSLVPIILHTLQEIGEKSDGGIEEGDLTLRWPVCARCSSPPGMPMVACRPAAWSTRENGLRIGGPPGSPVIDSMPQKACRTRSYPWPSFIGPRVPYPQ